MYRHKKARMPIKYKIKASGLVYKDLLIYRDLIAWFEGLLGRIIFSQLLQDINMIITRLNQQACLVYRSQSK